MAHSFDLDDASWTRLRELLDVALDLAASERAGWLETLPDADTPLRSRIAALLELEDSGSAEDLLGTLPRFETLDFAEPAAPPPHVAGDFVGPYKLLRPLGEGGMGSVWLARRADGLIDRPAALKLPRLMTDRGTLASRMARERRILSALNHEGIARLYDAGLASDGQPYLALEYVEGTAIDVFCTARSLKLSERLALFRDVVNAIAYAHGKLVVHRDLKPANILVTPDSRVKLLDFGIAKLLDTNAVGSTDLTRFHGRPLTLEFASPEQVRGEDSGTGSDIYSLGVILFHLLTGTRPYRTKRGSRSELEDAILNGEPLRPSSVAAAGIRSRLRGDLDTIMLKALRKSADERYATANALAEDIDRYLSDRPVLAQPDSRGYRLRKFLRRNRLGVAVGGGVAALAVAGISAVLWQAHVAIEERRKAEDIQQFISSIFTDADPYERGGAPVSAITLLERARDRVNRELADRPEQRVKMLSTIGSSLADMHEIPTGLRALDEAVAVATREFGPDSVVTLKARADRIEIARFTDEPAKISAELQSLMAALRAQNDQGMLLAQALELQTYAQIDAQEWEQAIESAVACHRILKRELGPAHKDTARSEQMIAVAYEGAKRFDVAEKYAREAAKLTLVASGGDLDTSDSIEARMIVVRLLDAENKTREALAELASVVTSVRHHYGDESMENGFYSMMLAKTLLPAGDPQRAKTTLDDVVRIFAAKEKLDGRPRPSATVWRAQAKLALHDAASALEDVLPVIAHYEKLGKPNQPELVRARLVAALANARLGHFDAGAEQLSAIPPFDKDAPLTPPIEHHGGAAEDSRTQRAHVLTARSTFARMQGASADAVALARQSLALATPADKAERLVVLPELGLALVGTRQYDEAQTAFDEAMKLADEVQIADSPERADTWLGLGQIAAARGDCTQARGWFERYRKFWDALGRKPDPGTTCT